MHSYQVPDKDKTLKIQRMMEAHSTRLLRLCILYLRDMSLAEDAVQETFVKAYKALDDFHGHSAVLTWLTAIAVNTCRNLLRTPWHKYVDRAVALDSLPEPCVPCEPYDDSVLRKMPTALIAAIIGALRLAGLAYAASQSSHPKSA